MDRRGFLRKATALSVGLLALVGRGKTWAKGLPSDPGGTTVESSSPGNIVLPPFEKNRSFTLDRALLERKTIRSFADRPLSREELSRLLWATTGVNREDGHRTIPSAQGKYPVDVLAALPGGVFRYEPKEHRLVRTFPGDIRGKIPNQEVFKKAAMIVLYVINKSKVGRIEFADIEIGCMSQDLYLESAALGMGSCIFAGVKVNEVTKILGLKESQLLRIAQASGPTK